MANWRAVLLVCLLSRVVQSRAPEGWLKAGKPAPDHKVQVTLAIKQTNTDWLESKLKAVSYPQSKEYGNYINFDEIARYVHGKPESIQAVVDLLASAKIDQASIDFTIGQDFAVVDMPFHSAETLFSADFYIFQREDITVVTSESFAVPSVLRTHVDFVSGISSFPEPAAFLAKRESIGRSDGLVTPETIATDYNTSSYESTSSQNSQAIAAFLRQYYDPKDLAIFQEKYHVPKKPIAKVVGTNLPDDPGAEANLDVQYISATGRNVDTWFISTSTYSNGKQEDFLSWIISQVNNTDSPWVHSASYGDVESSIDDSYLSRMDTEFMKFGVSGRTVLFASGDSGVACKGSIGKFTPNWPASSPYVTVVGGTVSNIEAWTYSGGGFSNYFGMPDYQKDAVSAFLKSGGAPSTKKFNTSGRAYPDVSAFAVNYAIIDDGELEPVDGTSCAAPTFAGIISSLNDIRLNKGQKTLGFLNPLLYQTLKGKGFFDIHYGSNGHGLCEGFRATQGWDPTSGWGSPNFGLLRSLI